MYVYECEYHWIIIQYQCTTIEFLLTSLSDHVQDLFTTTKFYLHAFHLSLRKNLKYVDVDEEARNCVEKTQWYSL